MLRLNRPQPPADLLASLDYVFQPAHDVRAWMFETILTPGGALYNPEHEHLQGANLGVLWTNAPNSKHGQMIAGTAEIPNAQGGKWLKARMEYQLCQWFGAKPDFLITLSADYCQQATDAAFCALVEHELYHCGQARDAFGMPKFKEDGSPSFALRGHDVSEFVGVVRRYGLGAVHPNVRELVEVAQQVPQVAVGAVRLACGNCLAKV